MAEDVKIAVFENGELSVPVKGDGGDEVVLALPLDRLLVKVLEIPADRLNDSNDFLIEKFKAITPFPDEEFKVSCETVRETESGRTVLAAALPESSAEDIAEALDERKLKVTRVDSLALGLLRVAWPLMGISDNPDRRLVLIPGASCISIFVLDGDSPSVVRAVASDADLKREALLSLVEAETFAGGGTLSEILVLGDFDASSLDSLANVRNIDVSAVSALDGIAERSADSAALNALPDSWGEFLEESRFKTKFKYFMAAAFGIWVLMLAVVIGVPMYYSHQTDKQKKISKSHQKSYREVLNKKEQVEAVRNVSNHDLGALETLRVVAMSMPDGLVLSRWNFKRGDILTFSGVSEDGNHQRVYDFKDSLSKVLLSQISGNEDDDETYFFRTVSLPKGIAAKKNGADFDVECDFKEPEGEY